MTDYFIFPVNFEDVEQENYNRHSVERVHIGNQDSEVVNELKKIDRAVFENCEEICKHETFDYLYHLIKMFSENIQARSMRILQKLSETLYLIMDTVLKKCLAQSSQPSTQSSLQSLRIAFKMAIFLLLYYITAVSKCKQKQSQADLIEAIGNKDKKKKNKSGSDVEFTKNVIENLKMCVRIMKGTLEIDFRVLWERREVDVELWKRYTDVCVKILESSIAKDENIINQIFYILEVIIKEKPQLFMNIQRVLINLVYESQMTDILVSFFSRAESPEIQRLCTETIICVVVFLVSKNLSTESSSIKNTRQFLSRLSEKIPKTFYNNLSCFIRLYLHESYHLRNAISDILMNILRYVLNVNSETEQTMNKARDKFINTLIQRIYDKSSFCRWHVLGILNTLTVEKVVAKKYTVMFLKAGVDRIKDHSVNTRKKALQLINTVIEDVWPEDKNLRSIATLKQEAHVINLNKQSAEVQLEGIKQKIQGQNYQSQAHLQKLTRQMNLLSKKLVQYQKKQQQLSQQQQIVTLIQDVLDKVKILLSSKTDTDVLETIRLFIKFYKRNIEYCKQCLPSIRLLIFSKQKKIKDEVLMTFTQLHLLRRNNQQVAEQLIGLFKNASPQDLSALEQILQIIVADSIAKNIPVIKASVFALLWHRFIQYERSQQQSKVCEKRAILTILRITFNKDPLMIQEQNVVSFLAILKNYIVSRKQDFYILREILKIIMVQPKTCVHIDNNARNLLLATMCILVTSQQTPDQDWYSVSQHLLTCIYKISPNPQKMAETFVIKLHQNLQQNSSSSVAVAHFIFTLSHSCLKMLIFLDSLENKIKALSIEDIEQKEKGKQSNKKKNKAGDKKGDDDQQQLDKVVGGLQAQIEMKVNQIQKLGQKLITDPFINRWVQVVQTISNDLQLGNQLQIIAVLSYCKFMCISADYCKSQFPNLLKILNKPKIDSVIKNNIIIAIGDLLHRFPNIVQPYSRYLYQNLHDKDTRVRKTTLTVLTHLALNDMIKVKGDICDIAMLFQDQDPQIQSLVKQFFSEVNRKDPKYLFNIIPEALTKFSEQGKIGATGFHSNDKTFSVFMENVLPLMEKDKYSESLIIKLCERLANSLNILQIRNTAYCLSEINMNEKGLRKLIQSFSDYKKTLQTPEVMSAFRNLITKLKKSTKGQIKNLVQELDQKISNANQDVFNADQIKRRNQRNQKKQPKRKPANSGNRKKNNNKQDQGSNTQSRKKKGGKKPKKMSMDEQSQSSSQSQDYDDSQDSDSVVEVDDQERSRSRTNTNTNTNTRPKRAAATNRRQVIVEESEENLDQEDYD